jgi:hypothetical protein
MNPLVLDLLAARHKFLAAAAAIDTAIAAIDATVPTPVAVIPEEAAPGRLFAAGHGDPA